MNNDKFLIRVLTVTMICFIIILTVAKFIDLLYIWGNSKSPNTTFKSNDILLYWGSGFSFIGTIVLGYVTFTISNQANKISKEAAIISKEAARISEANSIINKRLLDIEEESSKPKIDLLILNKNDPTLADYEHPLKLYSIDDINVCFQGEAIEFLVVNITNIHIYCFVMECFKIFNYTDNDEKVLHSSCTSGENLDFRGYYNYNNKLKPYETNILQTESGQAIRENDNCTILKCIYELTFVLRCNTGKYRETITFDVPYKTYNSYSNKQIKVLRCDDEVN